MKKIAMTDARAFAILRSQRRHVADKVIPKLKNAVAKAALVAALSIIDEEIAKQPAAAPKVPANRNKAAVQAHLTRLSKRLKGSRGKAREVLQAKIAGFEERLVAFDAPPPVKVVRVRKPRTPVAIEPAGELAAPPVEQTGVEQQIAA